MNPKYLIMLLLLASKTDQWPKPRVLSSDSIALVLFVKGCGDSNMWKSGSCSWLKAVCKDCKVLGTESIFISDFVLQSRFATSRVRRFGDSMIRQSSVWIDGASFSIAYGVEAVGSISSTAIETKMAMMAPATDSREAMGSALEITFEAAIVESAVVPVLRNPDNIGFKEAIAAVDRPMSGSPRFNRWFMIEVAGIVSVLFAFLYLCLSLSL